MTMITDDKEVTPEEQALLKLRLDDAVQEIVEKAVFKMLMNPTTYNQILNSAFGYAQRDRIFSDSQFSNVVMRAMKDHFSKHYF